MRNKVLVLFFACVVWLCFLAVDARACGCAGSFVQYQPCSAYWNANVVFVGQVSEVGPMMPVEGSEGKLFTAKGRVTHFTVDEAFRGVSGKTIKTVEQGTSCDYNFKVGERYFVYGSRDPKDGKVYVGSCSATKTLDRAASDLAFARGVVRGAQTPSLVGYVSREMRASAASYRSRLPLEGIRVVIKGAGRPTEVKTDADGLFQVFGLAAGRYGVRALTSPELRLLYGPETVEVSVTEGRCSGAGFTVTTLSTISGQMVDSKGLGIKTKVNLLPVDENNKELPAAEGSVEAYTDEKGHYRFDWVAPGRYLIAVNPRNQPGRFDPPFPSTYYPGVNDAAQAAVVIVADGQHFEAELFRLPPALKERTIEGFVLMPDGSPAIGATVILEYTDREWFEVERTDDLGRFTLKTFDGFKYLVAAELRQNDQSSYAAPVEVITDINTEPLKLIIANPGYYRPRYGLGKREKQQ